MLVPSGIPYFIGALPSSERNHPPMLTADAVGLCSSIKSCNGGSECVSASFTTTGGIEDAGSSAPGDPPGTALARHENGLSGFPFAFGFRGTNENPNPSGVSGHLPLSL